MVSVLPSERDAPTVSETAIHKSLDQTPEHLKLSHI